MGTEDVARTPTTTATMWSQAFFGPTDAVVPAEGAAVDRIQAKDVHAYFGRTHAVRGVSMNIKNNRITAIIGPSGCGKSTFLRCLNRMHELVQGARGEGNLLLHEDDM